MKVIWSVYRRELLDIVRDRRRFIWMLISSFIIFPILFVGPYAFILIQAGRQTYNKIVIPVQGMEHAPALMKFLSGQKDIETVSATNVEELVRNKTYSIGLIIPDDYEAKIAAQQTVPIVIVADQRKSLDVTASRLSTALDDYAAMLLDQRLQARGMDKEFAQPLKIEQRNAATATETTGSLLGLIVPGFIISIGLSAGMPLAVAAVAGEKKKQTLESVLFTPVSRVQLLIAKLLAILTGIIFNLLTMMLSIGISITILILLILRFSPDMLNPSTLTTAASAASTTSAPDLSGGYSLQPVAIILFLFAPALIILLGAALQLLISSWARNDEEAYTLLTPLSFLSGLVVFTAFFLDQFIPQLWHYALPIFGTILSMRDLLSNKVDPASLTVMFVSSAFYAVLMLALAVWMFNREEVVFRT